MTDPTEPTDPIAHPKEVPPEIAVPPEDSPPFEPEASAPPARRDPLPVLFGIGVLVLIGAVVFLWRHPLNLASFSSQPAAQQQPAPVPPTATASATPGASDTPPPPVNDPAPVAAAAPPPPPVTPPATPAPAAAPVPAATADATTPPAPAKPDAAAPGADALADLQHQLADLRQQVGKLSQQTDQVAQALANAKPPPPDLGPLDQRISALENRPAPADPAPAIAAAGAALTARIDALTTRADQMTSHQGSSEAAITGRLDTLEAKIGVIGKQTADLAGLSNRAARLSLVQSASAALAAGKPVGEIPDAPPALARFRTDPPPTEASLRLAFPAAAQAASQAAEPDTGALPFWQAVQNRAESLVTVRRGDHVVVGDPTAGVIARARTALDAGDLAGAVAAVGALTGPPAAAMAAWTGQAKALLDARAALATLAART